MLNDELSKLAKMAKFEKPKSRNWFTINVKQIKPFNAATPTTPNSSLNGTREQVTQNGVGFAHTLTWMDLHKPRATKKMA